MVYLGIPQVLNDELIRERHLERWKKHVGTRTSDWDAITYVNECLRADYVIQIAHRDGLNVATALTQYSISKDIIAEIVGTVPEPTRKVKRSDRYQAILDWAADNVELSITTVQVAEQFELSQATTSKFLQEHPDVFRPLKRGHFQIRDPKVDRANAKKEAQ